MSTRSSLFLGVHTVDFSHTKDPCFQQQDSSEKRIKLTTCKCGQFTCDDGQCIDIEERCDQSVDCEDFSDENNCRMIQVEENYNKEMPPFIVNKTSKKIRPANVNISVTVVDILDIVEAKHEIELKIHLLLEWFDHRLKYLNLKHSISSNVPPEPEVSAI